MYGRKKYLKYIEQCYSDRENIELLQHCFENGVYELFVYYYFKLKHILDDNFKLLDYTNDFQCLKFSIDHNIKCDDYIFSALSCTNNIEALQYINIFMKN